MLLTGSGNDKTETYKRGQHSSFGTDIKSAKEVKASFAHIFQTTAHAVAGVRCAVDTTVKEALDSFTISGARASFEENKKGRIAPGFYADFTVLAQNPFKVDPDDLHRIKILACYLAGRRVSS